MSNARLPPLFSLDPLRTDALERFVSACLASGGIWDSPQKSDGISNGDPLTKARVS